ncbi:hypothetical protein RHMOL_Rhmol10G0139300 [Rhododendron molle]|uniref:Uncharacterized protein n=1 Tax=Rhododendron molle TaxID=49168 RepID=A0ACC0M3J8_RHOML|nr:hypothetical protein RHMOL_Rhmol10G0139300 [Rhododendron molle]
MDDGAVANNVARAIVAALDWSSSPDARNSAVSYLESIKAGDVRVLANTSFILVKKDWSSEIRLHAFKMLQHLVRLRWDELNPIERRNLANGAVDLMSQIASPSEEWALKSQMAALVAEIVRREGLNLWQELLPSLVSLSNSGPIQAELVSMMLRWLPEDITVHNEDLEGLSLAAMSIPLLFSVALDMGECLMLSCTKQERGRELKEHEGAPECSSQGCDRRRLLLRGLTQSLPEILPLLYTLLERHFGAAVSEASRQQLDVAKLHAATVTATLNAINAYAEWAPVSDLSKYGLIHGCGFLLSSPDFRLHACEFFKLVSSRKRPVDDSASEFDSTMRNIFQILMNVSGDFLIRSSSNVGGTDESEFEFAEYICESMVSLGSSNLQCITEDSTTLSLYVQQECRFTLQSEIRDCSAAFLSILTQELRFALQSEICDWSASPVIEEDSSSSRPQQIITAAADRGVAAAATDQTKKIKEYARILPAYEAGASLSISAFLAGMICEKALLRDIAYKQKNVAHASTDGLVKNLTSGSGQGINEKQKVSIFVTDDVCSCLLDISFQRMLKKERVLPGSALPVGSLELWSDDLEGKGDFGQYRSKLVCSTFFSLAFITALYSYP